jgi:hypothetical protein
MVCHKVLKFILKRISKIKLKTKSILISLVLLISSCSENIDQKEFDFFLYEPCMIVNYEQNNTIEGTYLKVIEINIHDSTLTLKLPKTFFINNKNLSNWMIGWGKNVPLYDAGVENIREMSNIDLKKNVISLGRVLRGNGFPIQNQKVVFWNKNPSGFINQLNKPIIDCSIWPEFTGSSIGFSSIEYDSLLKKWIIIVTEVDNSKKQIYAAMSTNLVNWEAANKGKPILRASDFNNCNWAGWDKHRKNRQAPYVSDIVRFRSKWYLFMNGFSSDGKRHIGLVISENTLLGPYTIIEKPILSPGLLGTWNDDECFYAKVEQHKNGFILFYDGRNKQGYERLGFATSEDLLSWKNSVHNPVIDQHSGWRSFPGSSEPNYFEIRGDTIIVMCSGVKKFKMGPWHHYITKRMYLDKSGNVSDAQLWVYISTDFGKSFIAHINNPIFTNDYSNIYENEHMGGNFRLIHTDSIDYIFYQAKSSYSGLKYNILLRQRLK